MIGLSHPDDRGTRLITPVPAQGTGSRQYLHMMMWQSLLLLLCCSAAVSEGFSQLSPRRESSVISISF